MSSIGDAIQEKCMAFGDRVIKLNDFLPAEACKKEDVRCKKEKNGSLVNKAFDEKGILIGGFPAKKLKENVNWID